MKTILITAMIVVDDDKFDENDAFAPEPAPDPLNDLLAALIRQARPKPHPEIWRADPHGTVFTL